MYAIKNTMKTVLHHKIMASCSENGWIVA